LRGVGEQVGTGGLDDDGGGWPGLVGPVVGVADVLAGGVVGGGAWPLLT
jgi:hypothetical protein